MDFSLKIIILTGSGLIGSTNTVNIILNLHGLPNMIFNKRNERSNQVASIPVKVQGFHAIETETNSDIQWVMMHLRLGSNSSIRDALSFSGLFVN